MCLIAVSIERARSWQLAALMAGALYGTLTQKVYPEI